MNRHVAVDGGQSALRLRVLPEGRTGAGPGYAHAGGVPAIVEAVRQAARSAGLRGPVGVACLGLTGYPGTVEGLASLASGVAKVLRAAEVRISEDMVTAHAGALPGGSGVVLAAGTGVVCLAVSRSGAFMKVDGGGYLFGDAGSAFAIGRAGLAAVQRSRDGRGPRTLLAAPGLDPAALYGSPTLVDDVARFAPRVFEAAAEGDPVATGIVRAAAADLAETVTTAARWLATTTHTETATTVHAEAAATAYAKAAATATAEVVPVALTGGLFTAGQALLDPFRAALDTSVELVAAAGSPLDGAARLATGPPGPYADLISVHRFPTPATPHETGTDDLA
ncbi:N-acetylglucosamine kinase [Nonomuraea sediminis]|uniref:N-acetylglucosamine kinase n=1 Tax=Nonomuraea sediminis TaxID=2835864 RepID=UPI001BDC12B7|nr:BadF/BadG/BcrA/BcrD ATPase family protein [Nonomuraea sediminis]